MKKYLILNWWGWSSKDGWKSWLKIELESKAYEVFLPNLPNSNNPILEEQLDYINVYAWDFDEDWNIVGHSLWCQLALKFIEENKISNNNIILVAPSYPWLAMELEEEKFWDKFFTLEKYYNTELNFEKINKLNNNYTIFLSHDDPYINFDNAKKYYSQLKKVNFVEFKNKWHFNRTAWVNELKEILDY